MFGWRKDEKVQNSSGNYRGSFDDSRKILNWTGDEKSDLYGVAALIRGIGFIIIVVLVAKLLKKKLSDWERKRGDDVPVAQ